jgi:CTP:molybdopterin cytidylyltransferase MocA
MSGTASTTAGVLLAAGRGRRMGGLKQLLPWAESTMVAAAFDALAGHCGAGMVLVVGADAEAVSAALSGRGFGVVRGDSDAEQIESVRTGLRSALELPGVQRVFLHPADHPVIPAGVLDALLAGACAQTALIPTYRGRGGHPVLIPAAIAASIVAQLRDQPGRGLRAFWESNPHLVRRVEFHDAPELILDLDSPEDYEAARHRAV